MSVRLVLTGVVLTTAGLAAAPALAQELCDPYSQGCVPVDCESDPELSGRDEVYRSTSRDAQGNVVTTTRRIRGCTETVSSRVTPSTLPFTGGELVTLTAVGAGTLAGGVALVVAGRRRRTAADA